MVHKDLWDIWGLSAFTHLENVTNKKKKPSERWHEDRMWMALQRVEEEWLCVRECETQRHEWENERDEKPENAGEMKRKAGERGTEKKGIDEIEDYVE